MKKLLFWLAGLSLAVNTVSLRADGPLQRVPNTTLAMPPSLPSYNYTSANAFGALTFLNPVAIATPPGETNRIFIVEKNGVISVVTNLAAPNRTVFLDISSQVTSTVSNSGGDGEQGLLGLAFHPGYATNGFFYVFYTGNDTTAAGSNTRHDILSRFTVSSTNPNSGSSRSELKLIRQRDDASNHNGGDLHFGADGYLYVSLGDEGAGNDSLNNSQTLTKDFFSGILRIDVDMRPGSLTPNAHASVSVPISYAVPPDNPFVHTSLGGDWNGSFNGAQIANLSTVRTEFWAVGLRNPWRMSFDRETGHLYCGDVGQGTREEIDIIVRGGNYGWAYREGMIAGPKSAQAPAGFTSINPILDYGRDEGVSVTGGVVYRGQRFPELYGAYIFADYGGSGRIWMTRYNGVSATPRQLMFTDTGISAFGVDPSNGDVLYADVNAGQIRRMIRSTATGASLPATLAATGAFSDLTVLTPNAGIVPYEINVPFWSDNAIKTRWFSVPNTNLTMSFAAQGNWSFPTGSVWIKHFELELTNGVPSSRKRLETRLLVKNAAGVYGVTYRWGDSLSNASLVSELGMDEAFTINDGGILRTQVWRYPSRVECLQCHTPAGGLVLGFNTPQMHRDFDYAGGTTNQIGALSAAGYFSSTVSNLNNLTALAPASDATASLEYRVRSYLSANCVQCHQPQGEGTAHHSLWDARITTPTEQAGLIDGPLMHDLGNPNNRVIKPLSLAQSVMLTRISTRGINSIQMPPIGSNLVDSNSVALLSEWILSLGTRPRISGIALTGLDLVVTGTNGPPNGTYYLLSTTNIALPVADWPRVATNVFNASGDFNFMESLVPDQPERYYLLQLP